MTDERINDVIFLQGRVASLERELTELRETVKVKQGAEVLLVAERKRLKAQLTAAREVVEAARAVHGGWSDDPPPHKMKWGPLMAGLRDALSRYDEVTG